MASSIDPFEENIECVKGDQTKFFSRFQLDTIGENHSGTYDGWTIKAKKPATIPEAIQVTVPPVSNDPLTLEPVDLSAPVTPLAPVDPALITPALPETPVVSPGDATTGVPGVDAAKVETVNKPSKK